MMKFPNLNTESALKFRRMMDVDGDGQLDMDLDGDGVVRFISITYKKSKKFVCFQTILQQFDASMTNFDLLSNF